MNAMHPSRAAVVWLLLAAALLVRAAVPTGWMPMADGEGGLRIMLCSGSGAVELAPPVTSDRHDHLHAEDASDHNSAHHGEDHHDDVPHDRCPYGLALSQALDAQSPVLADAFVISGARDGEMPDAVRFTIRTSLRPPARGPPAIA